ncbi:hypothetical protein [Aeromonas veronii]|uniref:hypothetical protein n=1 Tax=Aeromonas veronii TaxID=654 RepID=UPI003F7A0E7A
MGQSLAILISTLTLGLLCNNGALSTFNFENISYFILGVALALITEYAIRFFSFKSIQPEPAYSKVKFEHNYFWMVISPGYFFSAYFKRKIQYRDKNLNKRLQKNSKAIFIKSVNERNLITSTIIFLIVFIAGVLKSNSEFQLFECIVQVALFFVLARTFSRSIEIIYAFTNDVINIAISNSSSLDKHDRIRLALNSYVENIINFSAIYYLLKKEYLNVQGAFFPR